MRQDVLWFDVSVDNAVAVRVVECVSDFGGDLERFVNAAFRASPAQEYEANIGGPQREARKQVRVSPTSSMRD